MTPALTYQILLVVQALHLLHHRLVKRHISFAEVLSAAVLCVPPAVASGVVPAWLVMSVHLGLVLVQVVGSVWIRKLSPDEMAHHGALIGEVRAASFLGADEEYVIDLDGVELRSIQPPIGAQAGDRVEVTIRPENCTVFADGEGLKSP